MACKKYEKVCFDNGATALSYVDDQSGKQSKILKLEYSRLQGLHQELRVEHAQVQSKNAPLRTMWRFRKDSFQPRYSSQKTLR